MCQSCLSLCVLIDCSPPGSSVRGILQARILEWVAMSFSRASSQQGSNSCLFHLLHWQADSLSAEPLRFPRVSSFKKPVILESSYSATISPKLSAPASILALLVL